MMITYVLLLLSGVSAAATKPNIVVIVADDLGWNDVGFHASEQIPTPNLDALAYDGVLLSNYYVQPICTPSRSALMSGRHPIHTGLQHGVILNAEPYGLGLNETLLPQYFKQLDYATHAVGKWHLGFYAKEFTPTYRGYDSFYGYLGGKEDYWDHTNQEGIGKDYWGLDLYDNMTVVKDKFGQYSTDVFTNKAANIIENHNTDKPLFMYLPYQAIHSANGLTPLEAPWEYVNRFQHIKHEGRRTVAAMTTALDDGIGRVIATLAKKKMLENTIIVFTTDNGGPAAGFDKNYANNFPLRGMKATLWEGGVRGDGFIWSPLLKQSPRTSDLMVHITDWLPTLLSASGYDKSRLANRSLDGVDQWAVLSEGVSPGTAPPRNEMIHNVDPASPIDAYALRLGDYKVVLTTPSWDGWYAPEGVDLGAFTNRSLELDAAPEMGSEFPAPYNSVVGKILVAMGRGKALNTTKPIRVECGPKPADAATNCEPNKEPCLYNVREDPCEYHNLAGKHPDILAKLVERVNFYKAGTVEPKNKPLDPESMPGKHHGIWGPWRDLIKEEM